MREWGGIVWSEEHRRIHIALWLAETVSDSSSIRKALMKKRSMASALSTMFRKKDGTDSSSSSPAVTSTTRHGDESTIKATRNATNDRKTDSPMPYAETPMDGASLEQDRKRTREASTLGASCEADAADILAELSSKFVRMKSPSKADSDEASVPSVPPFLPARTAGGAKGLKFDQPEGRLVSTGDQPLPPSAPSVRHGWSDSGPPIPVCTLLRPRCSDSFRARNRAPMSDQSCAGEHKHTRTLGLSGRLISQSEIWQKKAEQRNSQSTWKSEWAFPTGAAKEHTSFKRATEFLCLGIWGCQKGDCLSPLQTLHVMDYRRKAALRAAQVEIKSSGGHDGAMMDLLDHEVRPLWNGDRFKTKSIKLTAST